MQIDKKINFQGIEKALSLKPEEVIDKIKISGLTGRGGAFFPTGQKWELTRRNKGEKIFVANADESEPGRFKDRHVLEKNPDLIIEGLFIGAYAVGVKKAFIYLREEYKHVKKNLEDSIKKYSKKYKFLDVELILGAGAYICGEETAILESIEGFPGVPRHRPPYPGEKGFEGKPTVINNVETLSMVPLIMINEFDPNIRMFSVSGNVENPGVYEEKLGITFKELMEKVKPVGKIKVLFFGASGGCLKYDENLRLDDNLLKEKGVNLGSGIIVVNEEQNLLQILRYITEFFVHESCGRCTPCREGNPRVLEIIEKLIDKKANRAGLERLKDLAHYITECSFCGLGQTSNTALLNAIEQFPEEFEKCLKQ